MFALGVPSEKQKEKSDKRKVTGGKITRTFIGLAAGLMLAGCGSPPQVRTFIQEHMQCPGVMYDSPTPSPDGALIYYVVHAGSGSDLRAMNVNGANDRQLLGGASDPLLSPDGSMLLYRKQDSQNPLASDYHLLDLATMHARLLVSGASLPAWSPDGRSVAFVESPQGLGPIARVDAASSKVTRLTDTPANSALWDTHPVWSPDGKSIAFTSNRDGPMSIYLMRSDGGQEKQLEPSDAAICSSATFRASTAEAWLPGGDGLIVSRWCGLAGTLGRATLEGKMTAEWLSLRMTDWSSLQTPGQHPQWSPGAAGDGSRFVVALMEGNNAIKTAHADGSRVTVLPINGTSPHWSADGRQILFAATDPAGFSQIFVSDPDGTGLRAITQNPGAAQMCLH